MKKTIIALSIVATSSIAFAEPKFIAFVSGSINTESNPSDFITIPDSNEMDKLDCKDSDSENDWFNSAYVWGIDANNDCIYDEGTSVFISGNPSDLSKTAPFHENMDSIVFDIGFNYEGDLDFRRLKSLNIFEVVDGSSTTFKGNIDLNSLESGSIALQLESASSSVDSLKLNNFANGEIEVSAFNGELSLPKFATPSNLKLNGNFSALEAPLLTTLIDLELQSSGKVEVDIPNLTTINSFFELNVGNDSSVLIPSLTTVWGSWNVNNGYGSTIDLGSWGATNNYNTK
ncbi:hypothetical protein [Vibrio harveyi]|uniref:hypothetical protein n=1 Tax=Vibrio harveyi TaxID=669 RepID=UPI0023807D6A|nr:hypothetical protein [Vibrio harveyi]